MDVKSIRYNLYILVLVTAWLGQRLEAQVDSLPISKEIFRSSATPYRSISTGWSTGIHGYSNKFSRNGLASLYNAIDVRYGWQATQAQPWAKDAGYPSYGIGLYTAFLGDERKVGRPVSVYGFLNKNLFRLGQQRVETALSLGLAADLARYTSDITPIMEHMGSRVTVFFDLRFGLAMSLTRELDLTTGVFLTHMSNGRTYVPNFGLNASGLYLGTRYYYHRGQIDDPYSTFPARFPKPMGQPRGSLSEHRQSVSLYAAGQRFRAIYRMLRESVNIASIP
ncbi:MAG: acyloxyacyl hydrolase [Porphyromonadaceae bacterium]|nr:acyloxyacyl hydrolase [Porphyromonadaceae bacterium]